MGEGGDKQQQQQLSAEIIFTYYLLVFLHYLRILKFKKSYKQALHDAALQ
jgi:hypothetical protein